MLNTIFLSLTLHPDRTLVATGQIGKAPYICVWDTVTTETVSILKDGHQHGVGAVGFNKEGTVRFMIFYSLFHFVHYFLSKGILTLNRHMIVLIL